MGDQVSSRAAQLAIEEAQGADQALLVSAMHGHVREAVRSMYANYVLQKIVEVMPHRTIGFIMQELLGGGREVARHPFGCRIFCRLLEHASLDAHLCALLDEVLADASALCKHAYG